MTPIKAHLSGRSHLSVLISVVLTALALFAIAPSASASLSFCTFGSAAGQCDRPAGLAVDTSNGHVYVVDRGNHRINAFDSAGNFLFAFGWGVADGTTAALQTCTTTCFKGIDGSGSGQFNFRTRSIAIDNDPASASYRDLYVGDGESFRVQKFTPGGEFILMFGGEVDKTTGGNICTAASGHTCGVGIPGSEGGRLNLEEDPVAVGLGGIVYVGDSRRLLGDSFAVRVERFEPTGAFLGQSALPGTGNERISSIVADSSGEAYVRRNAKIEKYELSEPNATMLWEAGAGTNTNSIALDSVGHVFAAQREGIPRIITEYDSSGNVVSRFGYGEVAVNLDGLAVTEDGIYGSEEYIGAPSPGNRIVFVPFPPPGPIACCIEATGLGSTKATLKAGVNPEGKSTTYHFEYIDQAAFEAGGFSNPAVKKTAESAPVGSDITLHAASAEIGCPDPVAEAGSGKCLAPETEYHFRIVATNLDGQSSAEGTFTTGPSLKIEETFATDVGTDSARIHAAVNPLGIPATGYLQYVDDATYQADVAASGAGHGFDHATDVPDVPHGAAPFDFGSGGAPQTRSAQLSSLSPGTTYHYRVIASNPLVSLIGPERAFITFPLSQPPSNSCPNSAFRTGASAKLPDCRAYEMVSPLDKGGADIGVLVSIRGFPAGLFQSSADGDRFAYSSTVAFGDALSAPYTSQYLATRSAEGWSTHGISPPRESGSVSLNAAAEFDSDYRAFSADLSSGWLMQTNEPQPGACGVDGYLNLYRRDAGGGFEALTTSKPAAPQTADAYYPELQGLSADGTHAVFAARGKLTKDASAASDGAPIIQLYEHVAGKGCGTLRLISVLPNGKASDLSSSAGWLFSLGEGRENNVDHAVSTDGQRIFWSSGGALYVRVESKETLEISPGPAMFWTAATDGSRAFFSVGNESAGQAKLFEYDLAAKAQTQVANKVFGVVGASGDGSRLYFVSAEVLAGAAQADRRNLYLREAGAPMRFIGTLADPAQDASNNPLTLPFAVGAIFPAKRGTRLSADGSHLAFLSTAQLTGYDNADAAEPAKRDLELYLYDAEGDQLHCISCNPSGARPEGRPIKDVGSKNPVWVSGRISPIQNDLYAPHILSPDGNRLFFESYEALLPRDTNGAEDVYQWERAAGQAQCDEIGAELYVQSAAGCLSLISSGKSPTDSFLDDASSDGSDVFIRTAASLLPQDPGLVDIYDARVDGGFPSPSPPPVACEGEACQSPPAPPNDPTPASATFEGAGNLPKATTKPRCRKPKVRRKGHCVPRHHKRHKHKRGAKR